MGKSKSYQLDVDSIGSQEQLTVEEQNAISAYIAPQKKGKAGSKGPKKKNRRRQRSSQLVRRDHTASVSRRLGLLERKQNDRKTVEELDGG